MNPDTPAISLLVILVKITVIITPLFFRHNYWPTSASAGIVNITSGNSVTVELKHPTNSSIPLFSEQPVILIQVLFGH